MVCDADTYSNIKIFVCCHKPDQHVPVHPLLCPIQVGAALSNSHYQGFFHDDTGENISLKNRSYCELTAQYWAWKNVEADYYGFFHYRRYLYPDPKAKYPYKIIQILDRKSLDKLNYYNFSMMISSYDLVVPMKENMYKSVRTHYADALYHHKKDLDLIESIIRKKYPEYIDAMEEYLSGTTFYFGNICIMKRTLFQNYCEWLFDILKEFDSRVNNLEYSVPELRVDGYLAERLFGIYVIFQGRKPEVKIMHLPRVHSISIKKQYYFKKLSELVLKPGSYRRSVVKKIKEYFTREKR